MVWPVLTKSNREVASPLRPSLSLYYHNSCMTQGEISATFRSIASRYTASKESLFLEMRTASCPTPCRLRRGWRHRCESKPVKQTRFSDPNREANQPLHSCQRNKQNLLLRNPFSRIFLWAFIVSDNLLWGGLVFEGGVGKLPVELLPCFRHVREQAGQDVGRVCYGFAELRVVVDEKVVPAVG